MKTLFLKYVALSIVAAVLCLLSNCSSPSQSPPVVIASANSAVYGSVGLGYKYTERDTSGHEITGPVFQGSTMVEIMGTVLSTISDSVGYWHINGIDSGTYTLRFTHVGYDTLVIPNIHVNGNDTLEVKRNYWGGVYLYEDVQVSVDTMMCSLKSDTTIIAGQIPIIEYRLEATIVKLLGTSRLENDSSVFEIFCYVDTIASVSNTHYISHRTWGSPFAIDTLRLRDIGDNYLYVNSKSYEPIAHGRTLYFRFYTSVLGRDNLFKIIPPTKIFSYTLP